MSFKDISLIRGKKRTDLIKSICNEFYKTLKENNKIGFEYNELISFVGNDSTNIRTQQRIIKSFLDYLITTGKIRKTYKQKNAVCYLNEKLFSRDYGSFKLLMEKNGYKQNDDGSFKTSLLPQNKQGCFSYGNKSIRRQNKPYLVIYYEIV